MAKTTKFVRVRLQVWHPSRSRKGKPARNVAGQRTARWLSIATAAAIVAAAGCAPSPTGTAAAPDPDPTAEVLDAGAATAMPAGECAAAGPDGWTAATRTVAVQGQATTGRGNGAACTFARQRAAARAEQACTVNYSNSSLYRNGRLVSAEAERCDCIDVGEGRSCTVSAEAHCEFETRAMPQCSAAQPSGGAQ
jgi:hypothetical protein